MWADPADITPNILISFFFGKDSDKSNEMILENLRMLFDGNIFLVDMSRIISFFSFDNLGYSESRYNGVRPVT